MNNLTALQFLTLSCVMVLVFIGFYLLWSWMKWNQNNKLYEKKQREAQMESQRTADEILASIPTYYTHHNAKVSDGNLDLFQTL